MTTIRLRDPADVVAALPYQLGYHPQDSVVVMCLHDRQVGMVQRLDLPPPDQVDAAVASLVGPLLRESPSAVVLVAYETLAGRSSRLLARLADALVELDIAVMDTLVVRDGRYYNPLCREGCCPPGGTALPDPSTTPAVADFVGLGKVAMSGREELAASVAPDGELSVQVGDVLSQRDAADRRRHRKARGLAFRVPADAASGAEDRDSGPAHATQVRRLRHLASWATLCDPHEELRVAGVLTPDQVADVVDSLRDVMLRDAIIAWLCPGTLPLDVIDEDVVDAVRCSLPGQPARLAGGRPRRGLHLAGGLAPDDAAALDGAAALAAGQILLARLQWLCRSVPDPHAAPVLTVLASVAWWHGDGTLARVAVDRALAHQPDYRLADLVSRMLDLGLRPGRDGTGLPSAG